MLCMFPTLNSFHNIELFGTTDKTKKINLCVNFESIYIICN